MDVNPIKIESSNDKLEYSENFGRNNDYDPVNEYIENIYYNYGFTPYSSDFAVELDWFPGYEFNEESLNKLIILYAKHNIVLHIDNGYLGGGGEVSLGTSKNGGYNLDYTNRGDGDFDDFYDYSDTKNYHDGLSFSYGIIVDKVIDTDGVERTGLGQEPFSEDSSYPGKYYLVHNAKENAKLSYLAHEIAHNWGLGSIDTEEEPGDNNHGSNCADLYFSVMNYNMPNDFFGLHDGRFGLFDDWGYLQERWSSGRIYI